MGLTTGLVPARVDAPVKQGLLELVAHAHSEGGWSLRRSCALLGLEHTRVLRWLARAAVDRLTDAKPGPDVALHALLDFWRALRWLLPGWPVDKAARLAKLGDEAKTIPEMGEATGFDLQDLTFQVMTMVKYRVLEPAGIDDDDEYYSYKRKR